MKSYFKGYAFSCFVKKATKRGGRTTACSDCGRVQISYNSCRNRNCPKCQGTEKEAWTVQQEDMLSF